jgi:hypothetical protein
MDSHATQPAAQPAPLKRLKTGPGAAGTAPGLEEASRRAAAASHAEAAARLEAPEPDPGPTSWVQMQLDAFPVL